MRRRAWLGLLALALGAWISSRPAEAQGVVARYLGVLFGRASTEVGYVEFFNATNANRARIQAGTFTGNITWTLPTADGAAANDCLVTNASGVLSFSNNCGVITSSTTTIVSGLGTAVGFNDGGLANFGDAGLTYNKTTDVLTTLGGFKAPAGSGVATAYGFTNEAGAGMWNNTAGGRLYITKGGINYLSLANLFLGAENDVTFRSARSVLTGGTMTLVGNGAHHLTTTHSYTWSNAQVVALGAVLEGNITVATLPAKTQMLDAMVVITGTAAGTTTLTVSCGDAVGGTPFTNYVVASDAKAAVNTVYGDAVAERGSSIDTEFWYLPSYTATTLITCHFIATGANLDQVTGSTGRVILTTRLLP